MTDRLAALEAENRALIADRARNEKANIASRRSLCEQRDRLAAQVAAVEKLADEMAAQHGQCWNSIFARRVRDALASAE